MQNKVAIVTGASRGIGKAISLYLANNGYNLLLIARNQESLQNLQKEIYKNHEFLSTNDSVTIACVDVTDFDKLDQVISQFIRKYQKIDLLVNSAGIAKTGTTEIDRKDLLAMLEINLIGSINLIHLIAPFMKKQKSGRIINITSRSGKKALKHLGGYAASKYGLMGFNEALYNELIEHGIYVTAICPGIVNTDMTAMLDIDPDLMINVNDIVKTIDYLLSLSNPACIKEITIECKDTIIKENSAWVPKFSAEKAE